MQSMEPIDINQFIDSLIEEMGMDDVAPDKQLELKEHMLRELDHRVSTAASQSLSPEAIDEVAESYSEITDLTYLIQECVKKSPEAQKAILEAMEEFKEQTLNAYFQIKQ